MCSGEEKEISEFGRFAYRSTYLVDVRQVEHSSLHDLVDQMRSDFGHFSSSRNQNHVVALQKSNEAHNSERGDLLDFSIVVGDFAEYLAEEAIS